MDHYESPEVKDLGSLRDLTLVTKDLSGLDGVIFEPAPGVAIPLGPTS